MKPSWWKGFSLTTDYLMSGSFLRLFVYVVVISVLAFLLLSWLAAKLCGWNIGESFTQLTNPNHNEGADNSEWWAIVMMNLFGLFVLNGVILTIFVNWVSNRKERHNNGEAHYPYIAKKRFSVIIGGHKMVGRLAHSLIKKGNLDFVLIQTQRNPEIVRKEIFAEINDERLARNVIIYAGDRTSWHELEDLHLEKAQEVYVIGEPSHIDGSSHDAINMQCWNVVTQHLKSSKEKRIPFHVMFEYQSTFSAFQYTDLKLEQSKTFRFIPFSIYETWAQQVLIGKNISDDLNYIPLDLSLIHI